MTEGQRLSPRQKPVRKRDSMGKVQLITLLFLFAACSAPTIRPASVGSEYFPDGQYQQKVSVEVTASEPVKKFQFQALIKKKAGAFDLVGFSPFGFSLFSIHQQGEGAIQAESSVEEIQKNQAFFLKVFKLVRTITLLQRTDSRITQDRISLKIEDISTEVQLGPGDNAGVPTFLKVQAAGQYSVHVESGAYKFYPSDPLKLPN